MTFDEWYENKNFDATLAALKFGEFERAKINAAMQLCWLAALESREEWVSVEERLPEITIHHDEPRRLSGREPYRWSASELCETYHPAGIDAGSSIQTRFYFQRRLSYLATKGSGWVHEGATHWRYVAPPFTPSPEETSNAAE